MSFQSTVSIASPLRETLEEEVVALSKTKEEAEESITVNGSYSIDLGYRAAHAQ